jgi:hypothetical protein
MHSVALSRLRPVNWRNSRRTCEARAFDLFGLHHAFHEVDYLSENDRLRYTIHPDARKELLKRLLQLNHKLYAEEEAKGLHKRKVVRKNELDAGGQRALL